MKIGETKKIFLSQIWRSGVDVDNFEDHTAFLWKSLNKERLLFLIGKSKP